MAEDHSAGLFRRRADRRLAQRRPPDGLEPLVRSLRCDCGGVSWVSYLWALTTSAKTYYLDVAHVYLLAADAVAMDGWLRERPGRMHNLTPTPATQSAGQRHDLHRRLRRGRTRQRARPGNRPADRRERTELRVVVGNR